MYANFSMSGGGNIKWDIATSKLSWTTRIITSPITKTSYGSSGFFDINMPTNTTITHYNGNSGTATQTITTTGITLNPWNALYYKLPIGSSNATVNSNFVIVNFTNSTWVPDSTWVLIAVRNGDDNSVKFLPAGITFSNDATSTYSSVKSQWIDKQYDTIKSKKMILSNGTNYWVLNIDASGNFVITPTDINGVKIAGKKELYFSSTTAIPVAR